LTQLETPIKLRKLKKHLSHNK